jgi:predicted metal-dependent hydrolase
MALEITRDLQLLVRVPYSVPREAIDHFIDSHIHWVEEHMARMQTRVMAHPAPSAELAEMYRKNAKEYIPSRVAYYSEVMSLVPTGITITGAKNRFGSCSGKNRLSFSWRLMEYPLEAIDYVIVHELSHIAFKNHGSEFYSLIAAYLPDWKQRKQLLK